MANDLHLVKLREGVERWNEWVRAQRLGRTSGAKLHEGAKVGFSGGFWADLNCADLHAADLYQGKPGGGFSGIDLIGADLRMSDLRSAKLAWADLTGATLAGADLTGANLMNARLDGANLSHANLSEASLGGARLLMANLRSSQLRKAYLYETMFSDTDLSAVPDLASCTFAGPCTLDHRTLLNYGHLPQAFLRGCGLPESLVEYLPFLSKAPAHYSCFISYSSKDDEFVQNIYAALQAHGVRCWFAPHDLPIGAKTLDTIHRAIEMQDKLLLVLSHNSIASDWVEDEVSKAYAEERRRKEIVLFPVRIDEAVMDTSEPWAVKLRDQRNIGDLTNWRDTNSFEPGVERLLRDLRAK